MKDESDYIKCRNENCDNECKKNRLEYRQDGFCSVKCGNLFWWRRHNEFDKYRKCYCQRCGNSFNYNIDTHHVVVNRLISYDYGNLCHSCSFKDKQEAEKELNNKIREENRKIVCDWCGKLYIWKDSVAVNKDVYCSKRCEAHL